MNKVLSATAAVAVALLLSACASMPQWLRPPQSFQVSVYQPGAKMFSFRETEEGTAPTVNYELQIAERIEENYSPAQGYAYVIEPTGGSANTPAGAAETPTTKVKVTLRNGGNVMRVFYAEQFSQEYGNVFLQTSGARYCVIVNGDVTIESTVTGQEPVSETPRCLLQPK